MFDADTLNAFRRLGVDVKDVSSVLPKHQLARQLAAVVKVADAAEQLLVAVRAQEAATERLIDTVGRMAKVINTYCYNHCDHERGTHAPNCPAADMGWPVCTELPKEVRYGD